jgi:hypothetical protein
MVYWRNRSPPGLSVAQLLPGASSPFRANSQDTCEKCGRKCGRKILLETIIY